MAPKHDEIFKQLDDGLYLVWDTTRVDRDRVRRVGTVSRRQAAQLGQIVEGSPAAGATSDLRAPRPRTTARSRRRHRA
jgi:hypothetical protein